MSLQPHSYDLFPPEFDHAFYRSRHQDLRSFSDAQLEVHYVNHGRNEGRLSSAAACRDGFAEILRELHPALEIGPFDSPILPRSDTKFADHLSTEQLRERAAAIPDRIPAQVPDIHYVTPAGDLSTIPDRFKLVLSSHAIEHQPDLIGHLQQVGRLIDSGGYYALLIPDCRYCFDHFLPPSTIAEIIDAHFEGITTRHRLRSLIEHRALNTHNDPVRHWNGDHGPDDSNVLKRIEAAIAEWQHSAGSYIDVHAWQFTPDSFRGITASLFELGMTELRPLRVYNTPFGSLEFCALLAKD